MTGSGELGSSELGWSAMRLWDKLLFWKRSDGCDPIEGMVQPVEGYEVNGCFTGTAVGASEPDATTNDTTTIDTTTNDTTNGDTDDTTSDSTGYNAV